MSARQSSYGGQHSTLLSATITTAAAGVLSPTVLLGLVSCNSVVVQWKFTYGSGGTSVNAWFQTSIDNGATWVDIIAMPSLATASATKIQAVVSNPATALAAAGIAPTDGSLTQATVVNGVIGDRFRIKYTSVGTYAGTTLVVDVITKP